MKIGAQVLVGIIALEHLFIAWLEMFAWSKIGAKFFPQFDQGFLEKTKKWRQTKACTMDFWQLDSFGQ